MRSSLTMAAALLPFLAQGLDSVPAQPRSIQTPQISGPKFSVSMDSTGHVFVREKHVSLGSAKQSYRQGSLKTHARAHLGDVPYGQVISSCTVPGTMALTFDDGPWIYTEALLDLLESEGAHATFFVCGGNMAGDQLTTHGNAALLRRMVASGHQVGTHTWGHADLAGLDAAATREQLRRNEEGLAAVLPGGAVPTYFRPPYLSWSATTLDVLGDMGYHVVTLDLDTRDWAGDYDAARQTFEQGLGDGRSDSRMVLAHDIHERTVAEFARFMIDTARERGYRLVTVGECLGDAPENWYRSVDQDNGDYDDDDDEDDEVVMVVKRSAQLESGVSPDKSFYQHLKQTLTDSELASSMANAAATSLLARAATTSSSGLAHSSSTSTSSSTTTRKVLVTRTGMDKKPSATTTATTMGPHGKRSAMSAGKLTPQQDSLFKNALEMEAGRRDIDESGLHYAYERAGSQQRMQTNLGGAPSSSSAAAARAHAQSYDKATAAIMMVMGALVMLI